MKQLTAKQKWAKKHPERAIKTKRTASKKHYLLNRDKYLKHARKKKIECKYKVLSYYSRGGKPICSICNYDNIISLDLDHIEENTKPTLHSQPLYKWIIANNFPAGFQVLCRNHNYEKFYNYMKSKQQQKGASNGL